jgi:ribonuclease P protein component
MKKNKILSDKKKISLLFDGGSNTINRFPFHVKWIESEGETQTLFTVPVKKFKRANKRNKIKRQLKAIYDKYANFENKLVVVIFTHKEEIPFQILEKELKFIFGKLK